MTKITLGEETMERINALRSEIGKEMDCNYDPDDIINMAIIAFEDVRQG